jgi:hypothetical protein
MWSNGDLSTNALLASYVERYPEAFELRVANSRELSKGTPLRTVLSSPATTRRPGWMAI